MLLHGAATLSRPPICVISTVAAAALLALYAPDATTLMVSRGDMPPTPRPPASKEDVRARLALLQGVYLPARISRQLTKELNNFFVAELGGWRTLDLQMPQI